MWQMHSLGLSRHPSWQPCRGGLGCSCIPRCARQLLLHVAVADGHVVPLLVEVVVSFFGRSNLHEGEEVLDDLGLLLIRFRWTRIGYSLLHFLLDGLRIFVEVDAVAFRFAHLARAIESRNLDGVVAEVEVLGC